MQFSEALRYLLDLGHETLAIKLGLKNIELLLATLGHPQKSFPAVQIAGTNGKGSTAVVLDSICRAAGIRTGLYTSPHLVSITERIRVAGIEISQDEFARQATLVRRAAEQLIAEKQVAALPTFFEQVTAIALSEFRDRKVELAVLETGLGGRLDATTAAQASLVAITAIALDHQQYLGDSLASIAAEKAAIIRPGVNAIIGKQADEALDVILRHCTLNEVNPSVADCRFKIDNVTADGKIVATFETAQHQYRAVPIGLRGLHQLDNIAVAIRLAETLRERGFAISAAAIIEGIRNAKHPGRLELWQGPPGLLFDGAHNVAGALALRAYLDEFIRSGITLVFGAMADKNLEQMAAILFPVANRLVLTQPQSPRAAKVETLKKLAATAGHSKQLYFSESAAAAIAIAKDITPEAEVICITGSLYLVGEIQSAMRQTSSETRSAGELKAS
ncbi:MAG TPA: folylpolyglutamate synthase/dihydrofolate synthase family protein [Pyrinomonadaceae bacterium]|nr:folylpolyglutamate synthase/dihydrofolate synthase family protein [Pyrinomonadaceae bacterium]